MFKKTTFLTVAACLVSGAAGAHDMSAPAPRPDLASEAQHGSPSHKTVRVGDLEIISPFARATLPNQPVAGGFLTITNTGVAVDTLISVATPAAGRVEIHEMAMDGDVMRMRALGTGLAIPAGKTVSLKPGGYHIMFMDIAKPFVAGESIELTLTFTQANEVTITMPIVARDAVPGGEHKAEHHGHGSGR